MNARIVFSALLLAGLGGCIVPQRLAQVGREPVLTPIEDPRARSGYRQVSLPMPEPESQEPAGAASLWRSGARGFFRDQRARRLGDVLTVKLTIDDEASLSNRTDRSRKNADGLGVGDLFGLENKLTKVLTDVTEGDVDPESLVSAESNSSNLGRGAVQRSETVDMNVAAVITQVLPNGNMVIEGRQEVRVNFEVREVIVAGIVRPEDITPLNTIGHEKIAELRVGYGGRGQITDVQQPRYGAQVLDVLLPY